MDGTVLIADDDRTIRTVLTQAMTRAGCKVHATSSLTTLLRWVEEGKGDLVISDVMMPDGNGLDMLPKITAKRPHLPVIIISAQNTIVTAVKAAEAEAFDYLPKPFDLPELMRKAGGALAQKPKKEERPALKSEPLDIPLIGRSSKMQALYRMIAKTMNTDVSVLVIGESGVGKSLVAQTLHQMSERAAHPLQVVTSDMCSGVSEVLEYVKAAQGGAIVFEAISDWDAQTQTIVLQALSNEQASTARIMATATPEISQLVAQNKFRNDLFFRLAGVTLHIPALRDRLVDIDLLATHFLNTMGGFTLSEQTVEQLKKFTWPGNVRQLQNVLHQISMETSSPAPQPADVVAVLTRQATFSGQDKVSLEGSLSQSVAAHVQRYFDLHGTNLPPSGVYQRILAEFEAPLLEIALVASAGNQAKCAELLGINRNTLRKKLNEHEIEVTRHRKLM